MTPAVEQLLAEIAPVIEKLVTVTVQREVHRALTDAAPLTWRGAYVAGHVYGADSLVEHDGAVYRAIDPTTAAPPAGGWRLIAGRPQ